MQLNAPGRQLLKDAREAVKTSRAATDPLNAALASVGSDLEKQVVAASATLRTLMVVGVAFACLLVAMLAYFQWLKARHERLAVEAQNQTRDILSTVKDGLFLIDADFRIGKAHSAALSALFRRDDFDNMTLEELLRDTVSERTLATATKYVKLLWGERANENLIRSINPLAEVEVHFDREDGRRDLRYLEFDFHRVKGDHGVRHILVSVNDVTSRVLLARELKESQANAQGQMDMLLGLLQVDPRQLVSFLDDTGAALGPGQQRPQGPGARRRRLPRQGRPAVPRNAPHQGRGGGLGPRLGRGPRARVRGPAEGVAGSPAVVRQRLPVARREPRRDPRAPAVDPRAGRPRRRAACDRVADGRSARTGRGRLRSARASRTWRPRSTRWRSASPRTSARRSGS